MNREEASSTIDRWDQQYRQTKTETEQKARRIGASAASGMAKTAWWSFAFLILGACAAALGGLTGTRGLSYTRTQPSATA
jgi:hypothetical protein